MPMYELKGFAECDVDDPFFDSLKEDYNGFEQWFKRKSDEGEKVYVSMDNGQVQAFVYIKEGEQEAVGDLPESKGRLKIGTLKISKDSAGKKLGEGAIGLALWRWQQSDSDEIYVTVYPKHDDIISLVKKYGFHKAGNKEGEEVYVKDKRSIPLEIGERAGLTSLPYIDPDFKRAGYIPIYEKYHDVMFPYSELMNTDQTMRPLPVSNGINKSYVATPKGMIDYRPGDIVLIYRISETDRRNKSAATSYCTVSTVRWIKRNGKLIDGENKDSFKDMIENRTVYSDEELDALFTKDNLCVINLLYNGYFGAGHNINYRWLHEHGYMEGHPYEVKLTPEEFWTIMKEGGKDEKSVAFRKA